MIIGYVRGQSLTLAAPRVVADSINYLEGRFITSWDWAGLSIWAHFSKGDTFYDIPLDDEGRFTKEMQLNLTAGDWNVYVHGNEFLGDEVIERITTNTAKLIVEPTGVLNGEPFPSISTSAGERIIAQAMGYATDAAESANDAEAAAQTYPYIDPTSKHWMVWDVTSGEYVDTGISAEGQGGGGGTSDHSQLTNRSAANQHPMSAITGLESALAGKQSSIADLAGIRSGAALGATAVQPSALEPYATTEYVDGDINDLQEQIDALVSRSDVVDVVGTYAELLAYDTSSLGDNDVVKVLDDSTHSNARSYYRWHVATSSWEYVGSENIGYTKAEADTLLNAKQDKNIGTAFAGQFLVVGADGNITTQSLDSYEGGSY